MTDEYVPPPQKRQLQRQFQAPPPRSLSGVDRWELRHDGPLSMPAAGPLVPNRRAGCDDTTIVNFPTISDNGAGARLFYDPNRRAFRAGRTTGRQWDWDPVLGTGARGLDSVALGVDTVASGAGSVAIGTLGAATGAGAFALGSLATAAHDHALVWAGAAAAASTAADQVTLGALGGLRLLGAGGDAGLHSLAGSAYLDVPSMFVSGPVRLRAVATPAVVADAGTGAFFVGGSGAATFPMFQYATGTSVVLGAGGVTAINVVLVTTSATYTPPANLLYAVVEAVGGGGGGGRCGTTAGGQSSASAGGAAGGYARSSLSAAAILPSKAVTVGGGGAGGAGPNVGVDGSAGTASSFGALVAAGGGAGGAGGTATDTSGIATGALGGAATAGTVQVAGAPSADAFVSNGDLAVPTGGAGGPYGAGGTPSAAAVGGAGQGYGSGGGGTAVGPSTGGFSGGAGGPGVVVITEFLA